MFPKRVPRVHRWYSYSDIVHQLPIHRDKELKQQSEEIWSLGISEQRAITL